MNPYQIGNYPIFNLPMLNYNSNYQPSIYYYSFEALNQIQRPYIPEYSYFQQNYCPQQLSSQKKQLQGIQQCKIKAEILSPLVPHLIIPPKYSVEVQPDMKIQNLVQIQKNPQTSKTLNQIIYYDPEMAPVATTLINSSKKKYQKTRFIKKYKNRNGSMKPILSSQDSSTPSQDQSYNRCLLQPKYQEFPFIICKTKVKKQVYKQLPEKSMNERKSYLDKIWQQIRDQNYYQVQQYQEDKNTENDKFEKKKRTKHIKQIQKIPQVYSSDEWSCKLGSRNKFDQCNIEYAQSNKKTNKQMLMMNLRKRKMKK